MPDELPIVNDTLELPTPEPEAESAPVDLKQAKKLFSRLGWYTVLVLAVGTVLQILLSVTAPAAWQTASWYVWAVTFAPLYLVAFPLSGLLMRRIPALRTEGEPLSFKGFLALVPISIFLMYAGNYLGVGINMLLEQTADVVTTNPIESYAMDENLALKVLCLVVLAPLFEELLFRRWLIDRMRPYGERLAVIVSALMFGLFHGNLSQFFYAAALGVLFGYVYVRTGKLRYTVALHMFINAIGSVIGPALVSRGDTDAPDVWTVMLSAYSIALLLAAVAGMVMCIRRSRSLHYEPAPLELPRGKRFSTAFLNPGMMVMVLGCLVLFAVTIFGA